MRLDVRPLTLLSPAVVGPRVETTRHFTGTVYVVAAGATALHSHKRMDITIPPGGHVDRGELPHEAAIRECEEEIGLTPTILRDDGDRIDEPYCRQPPQPRRQLLYDVNVHDGAVGHRHVDHIYYATVPSRDVDPAAGEADAEAWAWYTPADLRRGDVDPDVVELGTEAIRAARRHGDA